jgi:hypothetical protein
VHEAAAALARRELPAGRWTGLLPFLEQCAASDDAGRCAAALGLCAALAEAAPTHIAQHLGAMQPALLRGLTHSDSAVRRASLETAAALIGALLQRLDALWLHCVACCAAHIVLHLLNLFACSQSDSI